MSRTPTEARRSVSALVGGDESVSLRFKEKRAFGEFAALLRDHHVPYELAGFQTMVLTVARLNTLPQHLAGILNQAVAQKTVTPLYTPSTGKRAPLTSPEKARELLKKLTKEL